MRERNKIRDFVVCCFVVYFEVAFAGVVTNYNIDENCPNDLIFHQVRITDCDALPCTFYREKRYLVDTDFGVVRNTSKPELVCSTVYLGRHVEWSDPVCDQLTNGTCPLEVGQVYTLTMKFKLPYYVPPRTYSLYCSMVDDDGEKMTCAYGKGRVV